MRFAVLALALACTQSSATTPAAPRQHPAASTDFDIIIRNGEVIDGSGSPRVRADVGIRGDTIAEIGDLSKKTAATTIDAKNQVVTPGFIDLLGHSEGSVLIDPHVEGKVRQGVTTEVTGEGHSPGPLNQAMIAEANRTRPPGFPEVTWHTLADFMRVVEKRGSAINFAFFIGAANPREMVIGTVDRPATAACPRTGGAGGAVDRPERDAGNAGRRTRHGRWRPGFHVANGCSIGCLSRR